MGGYWWVDDRYKTKIIKHLTLNRTDNVHRPTLKAKYHTYFSAKLSYNQNKYLSQSMNTITTGFGFGEPSKDSDNGPDPLRTLKRLELSHIGINQQVNSSSFPCFPYLNLKVNSYSSLNFNSQILMAIDTSFLYLRGFLSQGQLSESSKAQQNQILTQNKTKLNLKSRGPSNKEMRSYNGNIKLLHINKGNSHFSTKGDLVCDLIDQHKASIVSITESNARINSDNEILPFNDFNFEHNFLNLFNSSQRE